MCEKPVMSLKLPYFSIDNAHVIYTKKGLNSQKMNMRGIPRYTLVWGARYTLGARYLSKNMVFGIVYSLN